MRNHLPTRAASTGMLYAEFVLFWTRYSGSWRLTMLANHSRKNSRLLTFPLVGAVRNGSKASMGTIHGEIVVAKFLLVNGWSSFFWKSRADQSFKSTNPNICSSASSTAIEEPNSLAVEIKAANSTSKSSFWQSPETGDPSTRVWPLGRCTGVPDTTTVEDRPW